MAVKEQKKRTISMKFQEVKLLKAEYYAKDAKKAKEVL